MPCGSVMLEMRNSSSARAFSSGSSPSAPPMMKATSRPSCCQPGSAWASCIVVQSRPRSSSATMRACLGRAASIFCRSAAITLSALRPPERSSGLISRSSMRSSGGIRFVYSSKPDAIQPGILCPTARMCSFIGRGQRRRAGVLRAGLTSPSSSSSSSASVAAPFGLLPPSFMRTGLSPQISSRL